MAEFRLTPRPQVQSTANPQAFQVAARPVDMGANIRRNDPLADLARSLSAFNPALEGFAQERVVRDQIQDEKNYRAAKEAGAANAQRDKSGLPLDLNPAPDAGFTGAFQSVYRDAYRTGIAERSAEKSVADLAAAYADQKDRPDFDLDSFIAKARTEQLAGLDNDMAVIVGQRLGKFESAARGDYERVRLARLDEQRESSIWATVRNVVTGDDPASIAEQYRTQVLPVIEGMGKTKKEGAQYLLQHLTNISTQRGGVPELFDTLSTVDAAGIPIGGAELQGAIRQAKAQAKEQRDNILEKEVMEGNAHRQKSLDERVAKDPYSVSFEDVVGHLGQFDLFKNDDQVIAYWNNVLKARKDAEGQGLLLKYAKLGQLYLVDKKDQKDIMGSLTNHVVTGLSDAISNGNTAGVAALADALVQAHKDAGSNEPSGPIQRMFSFIGEGTAGEGVPPPIFKAAAEVYRRLENHPQLREAYFDENSRKVMGAYVRAVEGQSEEGAAYKNAYAIVSPEAKRREEAFKQTPEFKEKLRTASKWVTGSSWWPRVLGGNGRPENGGEMVAEAQQFAVTFLASNPSASDDEVMAQTESFMARSFVLDSNTGVAVKVPSGVSPQVVQEAVSAYTSRLTKEAGLEDRDDGWRVMMVPDNLNQGSYKVFHGFNGAPVHPVGAVSVKELVDEHRRATLWLPEDAKALKEAELALQSGQPVTNAAVPAALAKARQLKVQPELVKRLEVHELQMVRDILKATPKTTAKPDSSEFFKDDRKVRIDHVGTAQSAQRLLNSSNGGASGLAASLITMGEARMLRAYDDPAKGAGRNIGMGYNLQANKELAAKDLRAAGVPAERVQGIIDGSLELSPEQAERLTMVAVGRYESTARGQVEAQQPGLWTKLLPQQRAVLIDIAYQTGNVGQFKKALASLVSGDEAGFREQSKVHYTNRKGERVEDTRRNELRNAMLSGTPYWQAVLNRALAQPSPLQAVALNSPK